MNAALAPYRAKRDFKVTDEPQGGKGVAGRLSFVIQKHAASHLHYDFRLELDGTLKSWAVPKGPSLDPADRRMAVRVEDHPIDYGGFEGTIPTGQYGAGSVIVWDNGTWEPAGDPVQGLRDGKLKFQLHGQKLHGGWTLVRMHGRAGERQEPWLLIKERDDAARPAAEYSVVASEPKSVLSDRTIDDAPQAKAPARKAVATAAAAKKTVAKKMVATKAAAKKAMATSATVEGIRISHPERVIDPSTGATKLAVVDYYLEAARLILPHLVRRPVSLVRAPAGISGKLFFQRHAETLKIPELKKLGENVAPGRDSMVEVDSLAALVGSAQMNVIEFHTWNATTRKPDKPDRMIFDLDPGEGVGWAQITEGTEVTRAFLADLGLVSFVKTSGGKGLHVVVPITPKEDWDTVKTVSRRIVEQLARVGPGRFVAKSGPKNRVGRIFIDYLRNGFGSTTVCAWSMRARPGLGISVPCDWSELQTLTGGDHWKLANVRDRIEAKADPWAAYAGTKQSLVKAMKALGAAPP